MQGTEEKPPTPADEEALDQLYAWLYERGLKRLKERQEAPPDEQQPTRDP